MNKKIEKSSKKKWMTLTEIGRLFDAPAVRVGSELKSMGLRDADGTPTAQSMEDGLALAKPVSGGLGFEFYKWHGEMVSERLRQLGWTQIPDLVGDSFSDD